MDKIVEKLSVNGMLKNVYRKMADRYLEMMPFSLYYNYYELAEKTDIPAITWEDFLDIKEIDVWVQSKIVKDTEMNARTALNKLATSKTLSTTEVAAIKELLSKSKLLQAGQAKRPTVVVTYMPRPNQSDAIVSPSML